MTLSGRGLGGLAGGFTIKSLGSTLTFRIFAVIAAATAVGNEIIHQLQRCSKGKPVNPVNGNIVKVMNSNEQKDAQVSSPFELEPLKENSKENDSEEKC